MFKMQLKFGAADYMQLKKMLGDCVIDILRLQCSTRKVKHGRENEKIKKSFNLILRKREEKE